MVKNKENNTTYSHEVLNIVLNGAKNAFSSRSPTPFAALLTTSPITIQVQMNVLPAANSFPVALWQEVERS